MNAESESTIQLVPGDIEDLFGPQVDLHPDLEARRYTNRLGWEVIKHPLVISVMHVPQLNYRINQTYADKRAAIRKLRIEGDFEQIVWLYERPFRLDAFKNIARRLSDSDYWRVLGNLWIDSENIHENPKPWEKLLRSSRPMRHHIMDTDERRQLGELREVVTVHQGHTDQRTDGLSWTLSRTTAAWFARRFADIEDASPMVTTGMVARSNVIAYFSRRNEEEVLAPPRFVQITKKENL